MIEKECCPKFNPEKWDEKVFERKDKKFIKAKVFTLFYMPINFGGVIRKLDKKIKNANADIQDYLCLSEHTSKWNMNIYLAVDKTIPDTKNITISGNFVSKVYEGDFKETGKWCSDFDKFVKSKNLEVEKQYMWYTTCPKCAKKYGKNYVVIVGKIK